MPVYMRNGRRLGRAEEVDHGVEYVYVQQGRWLVQDWYIPMRAVRDVTDDGIYLGVDGSALERNRWNVPPEDYLARQGATLGYEYTSRADIPSYGRTPSSDTTVHDVTTSDASTSDVAAREVAAQEG
jgi:hypothetical protein